MIYFYHGADIDRVRGKALDLARALQNKKPDASIFRINSENFDIAKLGEYIESQGLFINKFIVVLDRVSENKDIKEDFLEKLSDIKDSENIFIIIEGKLDKKMVEKIEKKAEKTTVFDIVEKAEKKDNNIFSIANAFGEKNIKETWMLYRKAIDAGEAPEALHGMIFWKVKSLILSGGSSSWNIESLKKVMNELIEIYHESRRGKWELETRMERFLLEYR